MGRINQGAFGQVLKVKRMSDRKDLAAKCITMRSIRANSNQLQPYIEREISLLSGLECE